MSQDASAWIRDFERVLQDKGYAVVQVAYRWDQGDPAYTVMWSPPAICPWMPGRPENNRMRSPDPERMLSLLHLLPYNHLD